jgi:uncharacterized protein YjdB
MKKFLFVFVVFVAVACEKDVRLMSIDVVPNLSVQVGEQTQLQVHHTPVEAIAPHIFAYKTSDRNVATVDDNGVVICHQEGTCTITVATLDKRFTAQCEVVVQANNN